MNSVHPNDPGLAKLAGTEVPDSIRGAQKLTGMTAGQPQQVMPAHAKFARYGKSGATLGEWLPHIAGVSDDLCFVKSMITDQINHAPAMTKFLTGHHLAGRPSIGSWFSYGLGSTNRDLPDFLVLISKMKRGSDQPLYDSYWGSGFLPSVYQGVKLRSAKEPVLYLKNPAGLPRHLRRSMLDARRPRRETPCTSATCTPPSATSWASITRPSPTAISGLDFRLTGVEKAGVVRDILA